ncbi:formimidoylglutamase [Heyndrickxia sp. FSL K6-6286]|uniref:formimidoylglutamase n=1 Tax=Heyndrickxia sp. FSL K6-6286 TaxID=2921510 RepID=UPI00039EDBF4
MYIQPSSDHWNGRVDSHTDPLSFRLHQQVKLDTPSSLSTASKGQKIFGLIGFSCDEGVRRNQGRLGAAKAPNLLKQALAKLPWHLSNSTTVVDVGTIQCEEEQLEKAQSELGQAATVLYRKGITPIILGGGHETFYGHYLGARNYLGPDETLGIINIDAHFDMRPYDETTSSGTMFKQILDADSKSSYLCVGIQQQGNTKALFETAKKYHVQHISEEEVTSELALSLGRIDDFINQHDKIILTLCTDVISAAYAPGVSAPSPFGLHPKTVRDLIRHIVAKEKVLSFDVSEVNPVVDENNKTVTLAAQLINESLIHFHE